MDNDDKMSSENNETIFLGVKVLVSCKAMFRL